MPYLKKTIACLAAAAAALAFAPRPVAAQTGANQDSAAVAVNTRDGSSVWRISFQVKRIMDSDVDADNAAVAYASCSECETVAISFQVVLAMGDVDSLTTDNLALAMNVECSECETLAAAYQYVFGNGEMVRFTADGQRRLAQIRRELQALRTGDLTIEELAARLEELAEEVAQVVEEEIVTIEPGVAPEASDASSPTQDPTTTTTEGPEAPQTTTTTAAEETDATSTTLAE